MPSCEPWCPLIREQLKKIATEAPWILKKDLPPIGIPPTIVGKAADPTLEIVDEKIVSTKLDITRDDDWEKAGKKPERQESRERRERRERQERQERLEKIGKQPEVRDLDHRRISKEINGRPVDSIITATDTTKDEFLKSQITMVSKSKAESATQWSVIDKGEDKVVETDDTGHDKVVETDDVGHDKVVETDDRGHDKVVETDDVGRDKVVETDDVKQEEEMKKIDEEPSKHDAAEEMKKIDGEPSKHDAVDKKEDLPIFREECDQSCPRRISRKERIRKLEERQSVIDSYLLNKGTGYFDDVCTCSLSCILRALKDDSFVRSILTSVALFAFGLKLCSELNAWYLPIRSS